MHFVEGLRKMKDSWNMFQESDRIMDHGLGIRSKNINTKEIMEIIKMHFET